ncbi:MAG: choice-of-anchor B family protein [Calditrichaeota bacterium]|nr:choice-of-anchor B family protein [Calditrichota bacterium]
MMMRFFVRAVALLLLTASLLQAQDSLNFELIGSSNPRSAAGYNDCWGYVAPDGHEYALLGVNNGTSILDLADPANIQEVAFIPTSTSTWKDLKTYRHYAYVVIDAVGNGLQIIDLSDLPNSASLITTFTGNGFASSHNITIDTTAGMLYAQSNSTIRIIDLSDPLVPVEVGSIPLSGTHDVFAQNGRLYISEGFSSTFGIYDVSDPANPQLLTRITTPSFGYSHCAWANHDDTILITSEELPVAMTVKVWDMSDINNVFLRGEYIASATGRPHNVHIEGHFAFISHYWDGIRVVDFSDPDNPVEVAGYDTYPAPGANFEGCWGAYPHFPSRKVLASDRSTGLYVFQFEEITTGVGGEIPLPETFSLDQNYPNPFNPSTRISFNLTRSERVSLAVFNIVGQKIRSLASGEMSAGRHEVSWDGRDGAGQTVESGMYFYQLQTASGRQMTRKMLFIQ